MHVGFAVFCQLHSHVLNAVNLFLPHLPRIGIPVPCVQSMHVETICLLTRKNLNMPKIA